MSPVVVGALWTLGSGVPHFFESFSRVELFRVRLEFRSGECFDLFGGKAGYSAGFVFCHVCSG